MRTHVNTATPGRVSLARWHLLLGVLLAALALAPPIGAQSFLGSIRGTVVDTSGGAVPKAAVLITDEATGVPRTLETDAEGRYEAANLQPGTYKVEVLTNNFKKFERTGVLVRASGTALVDVTLEIGNMNEVVTVTAETINNITLDSQAINRGLDAQQLRDLPRDSRDIQSFLLLNPNVVGGSDTDIQFLGAKTYGVSYIQDGQASTNAIFGTVGNSAPGLDAVEELQVLSNSFSAEYGGLAGVVVTTKRGSNSFRGNGFYDFNNNGLNALTYNQKLSGVERGDPLSETRQDRWGGSVGGPIMSGKLFFFANYEGSKDKAIYGGGRATVPTEAMRNGDFRGTSIKPLDPNTGLPFPDQIIPADRIDPVAKNVMNFFYPLPNQSGTVNGGYGVFQQFRPETRNRQRADLRLDYQPSGNDSIFFRSSYQHRDPNSIIFEAGNALTNLGTLDTTLNTASAIGGWTKVLSGTKVNEVRVGYNYDTSKRQSTYHATEIARQLGLDPAPSIGSDRLGFPSINFQSGTFRPTNIADAARNVDRTVRQNSFSISDNFTWIAGGHSIKTGALWNRNMARDGFGFGVNFRGQYRFNARMGTGNAFTDFLLGRPSDVRDQVTGRGPLDGHSDDFAAFVQDDWKLTPKVTLFLGLRYEIIGSWHEKEQTLANFIPEEGGYHVVPTAEVAARLPPGLIDLGRTRIAGDVGLPDTLINSDKNNFSPRVGFAWRLDESNKTVLRGGLGLFHPTVAVQGIRDLLATNEFRYINTFRGGGLSDGFAGEPFYDPAGFGNQGIDPNLESPDVYQYNLTLERELPFDLGVRASYMGSTMRKLLVDKDFNTLQASTVPFDPENPDDYARLPFPLYGYYMDVVGNRGEGQFHAAQFEVLRRYKDGLAVNAAYTLSHSDSNAPDTGNSTIGPVMFDPYDIEKDRGPDPNIVTHRFIANATWDVPVGRERKHGADMPAWADALFGGWTVSTLFQARSGQHLTPFFSGFYTTSPWNTGKPLDGLGTFFCCAWRPDQIRDPNTGGSRDAFFDQTAYAIPADGKLGNAKKGSLLGPGTWVMNFGFYKDVVKIDRFRLQFSALLDNAFNHPQFFPVYGSGFVDLTSYLIDGDANNGTTGVLGADTIDNAEGFAPGRVIRLGIRATF